MNIPETSIPQNQEVSVTSRSQPLEEEGFASSPKGRTEDKLEDLPKWDVNQRGKRRVKRQRSREGQS